MEDVELAKHSLAVVAEDAVKTIAEAAKEATKVIAATAAKAAESTCTNDKNALADHDALTTLVANLDHLKESQEKFHVEVKESLKDLKENYSEKSNANLKKIEDHDLRIDSLEQSRAESKGKASTTSVVISYVFIAIAIIISIISSFKK